jgi:hypothetical protein
MSAADTTRLGVIEWCARGFHSRIGVVLVAAVRLLSVEGDFEPSLESRALDELARGSSWAAYPGWSSYEQCS